MSKKTYNGDLETIKYGLKIDPDTALSAIEVIINRRVKQHKILANKVTVANEELKTFKALMYQIKKEIKKQNE